VHRSCPAYPCKTAPTSSSRRTCRSSNYVIVHAVLLQSETTTSIHEALLRFHVSRKSLHSTACWLCPAMPVSL